MEGSEKAVLNGMKNFLSNKQPVIVMEYLVSDKNGKPHQQAADLLNGLGYKSYSITPEGALKEAVNIETYMKEHKINSDNLVFLKKS